MIGLDEGHAIAELFTRTNNLVEVLYVPGCSAIGEPAKCFAGEGLNYNEVIYVGAMFSRGELKVLEFNVRLGDPEAEVILSRIESDFVDACDALLNGQLTHIDLGISHRFFCNVVATQGRTRQLSADGRNKGWYKGWPYGRYGKGHPISGLENIDQTKAKTFIGEAEAHPDKGLVSDGGRVIHVVGFGDSRSEAVANVYANIDKIQFNGVRFRSDIGVICDNLDVLSESKIKEYLGE